MMGLKQVVSSSNYHSTIGDIDMLLLGYYIFHDATMPSYIVASNSTVDGGVS